MLSDCVIETPRLHLRNLMKSDVNVAYLSWVRDPEIIRFLELRFNPVGGLSELGDFVAGINDSSANLLFGLFRKDSGQHIGNIKLGPINYDHARAEIGFLIGERSCWGQGYASEAIHAVAHYGLDKLGLAKISSGCYETNIGSKKALLKAGFTQIATIPNDIICEGKRIASLLFSMDNSSSEDKS